MNTILVKQNGLGKSGTNYTKIILEHNYNIKVISDKYGNKHDVILFFNYPIIVTVKNPYAWLVSIHKILKFHKFTKLDFDKFLQNRLTLLNSTDNIKRWSRASNPIQYWNNYNWQCAFCEFKNLNIVKYESLLENPEQELSAFIKCIGARRKNKHEFFIPKNTVLPALNDMANYSSTFFDCSFYNQKKYLNFFSKESIIFVNENLDKDLMNKLNYSMES